MTTPPRPDSLNAVVEALKPCPFCGSQNIDPEGWASKVEKGPACDDCGASAETVERWNTRPRELSLPGERESDPAKALLEVILEADEHEEQDTDFLLSETNAAKSQDEVRSIIQSFRKQIWTVAAQKGWDAASSPSPAREGGGVPYAPATPVGLISQETARLAIEVHARRASKNVGPLGSDSDIRFLALSMAGEAGEAANVVKKAWRDNKPLNRDALAEEIAGTACYLVGLASALGLDLNAEMQKQMAAFDARYAGAAE